MEDINKWLDLVPVITPVAEDQGDGSSSFGLVLLAPPVPITDLGGEELTAMEEDQVLICTVLAMKAYDLLSLHVAQLSQEVEDLYSDPEALKNFVAQREIDASIPPETTTKH